jgi:hypothetical protein
MNRIARVLALSLVPLAFVGCETQDEIDQGGVIVVISSFDLAGIPAIMSVDAEFPVVSSSDATITVNSRPRNAGQPTSQLMDVIIEGYEVSFTRGDTGTRVPPTLTEPIGGLAPTPGDFVLNGLILMRRQQFEEGPLRDLRDFRIDTETQSSQVRLVWHLRFFGRTVSGELVTTNTISFNLDATP